VQKEDYLVPVFVLTIFFFVAVLGTLVFCCILLFIQRAQEERQRRVDARAAKARRLRYCKNLVEVDAPVIVENGYHLFLSHVIYKPLALNPELAALHMSCLPCQHDPDAVHSHV
jgi:hypothetical protein